MRSMSWSDVVLLDVLWLFRWMLSVFIAALSLCAVVSHEWEGMMGNLSFDNKELDPRVRIFKFVLVVSRTPFFIRIRASFFYFFT